MTYMEPKMTRAEFQEYLSNNPNSPVTRRVMARYLGFDDDAETPSEPMSMREINVILGIEGVEEGWELFTPPAVEGRRPRMPRIRRVSDGPKGGPPKLTLV